LAEALARETATSEILRVISQSPTEVQPVFEAIVRSGAALCHAPDVIILIADSGSLRIAASVGPVAASVRQSQLFQRGGLPLTLDRSPGERSSTDAPFMFTSGLRRGAVSQELSRAGRGGEG
jgi:hypothetical protein